MSMVKVNEVYRSIQGEGARVGTENIFVRFTGCNMRCSVEASAKSPGGFDCDTEFVSGRKMTIDELIQWIRDEDSNDGATPCKWVILTGGEPGLQTSDELIEQLHEAGYKIAIETNGSIKLSDSIDYVAVSPKVAEHCIRQKTCDEVRYVRGYGQSLPRSVVQAEHYLISPAANGNTIEQRVIDWCDELVKGSKWKVSIQEHKLHQIR
tara:strand:+ start:12348 stop:12971 length:624 start_codon:yes stop_codon:yes gene_type:complete